MDEQWLQHIGNDQLVHGLPKHMSSSANLSSNATSEGQVKTYWRYHPGPQACDKCKALEGLWFEENPGPVHPNCKCEIEEFEAVQVTGRSDAILVPPGVDIEANIREARQVAKECEEKAREYTRPILIAGPIYIEPELVFLFKCAWIFKNFKSGARYDFKQYGPEYEDFGNYHYGLYTKAMGIRATFAQVAAGAYQIKQGTSDLTDRDFIKSYGDDPRDNKMIKKGQQYPLK